MALFLASLSRGRMMAERDSRLRPRLGPPAQHILSLGGLGACLLGALLIVASIFWPRWVRTDSVWTDGQALEYAKAAGTYHQLAFEHGTTRKPQESPGEHPEVTAARDQYQGLRDNLDRARGAGWAGARILKWCGVSCALLGCALLMVQRSRRTN
jgi:hypothetical protein